MILDHIDNLELPTTNRFSNELQMLRSLELGLRLLYQETKSIEQKTQNNIQENSNGRDMQISAMGNAPRLQGIPQDILCCFFHWYSVSACDYVRLTGWLAKQNDKKAKKPKDYEKSVIPEVRWFRDKVAAHFSRICNDERDNEADRTASVIWPLIYDDGRFYVSSLTVSLQMQGKKSTTSNKCWSLTEIHEKLSKRYWLAQKK